MQAVTILAYGDADGMTVTELPDPVAAAGQLLIEVEAIGVGGVDAVIRRGTLGSGFPVGLVPGSEVAGHVIGVGDGVDTAWIGRRVWAFTGTSGGYAERAVAAVDDVTPLPETLTSVDAVTIGSAGPVARFGLDHARFAPVESLLIRGAAGSIGILAVQIAAARGAGTIAVTASSAERGERLRKLGATHVLDRSGAAADAPADGEAAEFDVVLDIVGGAALPDFIERLAPNGRLVSVGVVAGYPPTDFGMSLLRSFQRSLSFATFSLNTVPIDARNRVRADQLAAAARGELRAVVHDVLPLDRAADAHRRMDAGDVFGRFVLTP
ncbi:zinc-binding dehydrogenase [Leifsonia poae]|uniref:zinc-binding dehydrogenase n=1 Tax=Leifsonia poae TaxID=110933 RepID=UPI001CBB62F9|nr:zinc-binding dehydrogenase [Leifsonia poae]